ncbi:MAG TPA: multidrug efflux SMR transporter [Planococcus sp. (in: firmicutes)]|nr:multidrug efflux SMR transporter [Planococcus sp. (in: firmicutes)]
MAWMFLLAAGVFEIAGVAMITKWHIERNWKAFLLMVIGFGLSFFFLSLAMETLPMGTAYAVWTGIGASGGAIIGMLFYNEARDWKRILFIAMVLGSAVGLKMLS